MAETSSSRPLWIAAGAALAGLVVMLAVFAGPAIVSCTSDEAGFGSCVREKMADSGMIPPAETETPAVANIEEADPADAAEPAGATAEVAAIPELGLVRAEPDGSLVIAGSAAPGTTVEIYSNGELLGTATAESSGDWVLVPDTPLPPGGVEISVVNPETGAVSEQSVVVAINDDGTSEPLVVATAPGQADSVLQGLMEQQAGAAEVAESEPAAEEPAAEETAPAEEERMEVAAADPADEPAAGAPDATAKPETTAQEPVTGETATQADPAAEPEPAEPESEPAAPEGAEEPATEEPAAEEPAAEETPAEEPAAEDETPAAEETGEDSMQVANTDDIMEGVDALEEQVEALAPATRPTIDAIEIDGDRNFFAGSGEEGATVRLYVDNEFVGDSVVENGRWLLQTEDVLENRSQRVRVDQLAEGSAEVVARAEVEFVFQAPEGGTGTAVAEAAPQIVDVPPPDFGIDTNEPPEVAVAENEIAADTAGNADTQAPVETAVSGDAVDVPVPDFGIDTDEPVVLSELDVGEGTRDGQDVADTDAGTDVNVPAPDFGIDTDEPVAVADAGTSGTEESSGTPVASAGTSSEGVDVPEPDFSVDTGIPVDIAEEGEQADAVATAGTAPVAEEGTTPDTATTTDMAAADDMVEPAAEPEAGMDVAETEETAPVAGEDGEVPVLVAEPVGDPRDQRFASGKAIIRHGDNLWTIASRVYGSGYEYLAIYRANQGQIRDPDLIYPGQVFDLPGDSE